MSNLIDDIYKLLDERLGEKEPAVYEIDLTKKYILQIDEPLSMADMERLKQQYEPWIAGDNPIFFLFGKARLVKVETTDE